MLYMTRREYNSIHDNFKSERGESPSCVKMIPTKGTCAIPVEFVRTVRTKNTVLPFEGFDHFGTRLKEKEAEIRIATTEKGDHLVQFRFSKYPNDWIVYVRVESYEDAKASFEKLPEIKSFSELPKYE